MYAALYFPYIHFKNDAWLKLAALYWDTVARIVPYDYPLNDSDTVLALKESLVVDLRPTDGAREWEMSAELVTFLETHEATLQQRYGVERREADNWPVVERTRTRAGEGADTRLAYVHAQKIPSDVKEAFIATGLASEGQMHGRPDWLGMHPRLANVYMSLLAQQLAGHAIPRDPSGNYIEDGSRMTPVTDEALDHLVATGCSVDRLSRALLEIDTKRIKQRSADEVGVQLAAVAVQGVLPIGLAKVPVDRILKIREENAEQLTSFRRAIHDFAGRHDELRAITNEDLFLKTVQDIYRNEIAPEYRAFKKVLNQHRIKTAMSSVSILFSLPKTILSHVLPTQIVGAPANGAFSPEEATATVAAIDAYIDKRFTTGEYGAGERTSFLMTLERNLRPRNLMDRVLGDARRLWLGA